ncbi:MAG: dipeptidase [Anaerolineales bacterium]|nr:dipeptidase [Anaerolineales bacterium]
MHDPKVAALEFAHQNRQRFLSELRKFLTIPSISTEPERKDDILKAAEWLKMHLLALGLQNVQIMPTEGHPVVFAESNTAGVEAPTVLIYSHYDVQPPDPLDLWQNDPFSPEIRADNLYARGASDMKGQVLASIFAVESILRTSQLPINLKYLVEGEEEIGSPNLPSFISANKTLLKSDFALNPDTGMISADLPTITYALRGLAYFEIYVYGPDHDLHSGTFGGAVHNPAQALCELIAGMHDENGRVTLPGFYDKVRDLDENERQELARLPMDEGFYLAQTGAPTLWGESGYAPVERTGARPTLEVNGLYSGFIGEGSKTVLPARAMAKISTRLVPDQGPDEVYEQLQKYLKANAPTTIRYDVTKLTGGPASISDLDSHAVKSMLKALSDIWGKQPLLKREGGSVPVVAQFQQLLNIESVNCGFSLQDDNAHSPNEKLHLPTWYRGIDTYINFFFNLVNN